jgi:hypothetical protein
METLEFTRDGDIAWLRMNRPDNWCFTGCGTRCALGQEGDPARRHR